MIDSIDRQAALRLCIEGDGHDDERFTEGYNFAVCEIREGLKGLPRIEPEVKHPKTNADKIRAMDDVELAYFLTTTSCSICCDHPLNCGFDCASEYTIKAEKTEQEEKENE